MSKAHILIVDDEEDILELIQYNLKNEGFHVSTANSGEKGLKSARTDLPNLIILDLMLPGVDGLEVCKLLKSNPETAQIPILMLTAKGEEADVVTGLELGADDYLIKPFSPRVLLARIKAILRRKQNPQPREHEVLRTGQLLIHPGQHEVLVENKPVDLTHTEFKILHLLARRSGWVYTRDQIVDSTQGDNIAVTDRSVDVHIVALRKKLGVCGNYIETIRGVGYRFKEPDEE